MTDRGYTWRMVLAVVVLLAGWGGLAARLAVLHLGPNEGLRARVDQIRKVEEEILVGRGRILDSHGNILALDLAVKNVVADPKTILERGHLRFVAAQLSRLLQLDPAMVFARLNRPGRQFEYIKKLVPDDTVQQIRRLQLTGVFFEDVSARYYPQGPMLCHVVGFANLEGVGSAGVEQRMDSYLRGRTGLRISEKDGRRIEVYSRRRLDIAPQEGADVYLTVDQNLQYMVEKALDAAVEEHRAKGAWAIIERVRTGEILALACRPAYDPNNFRVAPEDCMLNRAIGYVYEPGSTFKAAVITAALNEGVVSPDDVFDCENGMWFYQGRGLRDFHPYGRLTVADIIKKSSNIGAAKVGLKLGERNLENYLRAFGFGKSTGLDLPGEEAGILRDRTKWSSLTISRIPMGHEVGVTSLQMLNLLCCIGNNGFLMRPSIVQRIVDKQGRTIMEFQPEVVSKPIREDTARLMQKLLARVTEEGGTGTRARVEGYSVAGKTGTAQKAIPGGYSDMDNVASFVGFLPAENPEIGIIVVVDEPQPLHTGGVVAAPVFQEIAAQAARYLDIPPASTESAQTREEETSSGQM
ncbi:MAG: penicillin-binding protein 2 [Verrucomicrobiota bacterium]